MTNKLTEEINKIFEQTISDCDCPTVLSDPLDQDFTKIRGYSIELCYEKEYNEETDEIEDVLVRFDGSNPEFEKALYPLIEKFEDPRQAWMECATLLFEFLKNRALEAIDNDDDLLAIGYIESLDYQAHCIDRVANNNKMRTNKTLIELNELLKDILDVYGYNDDYEDEDEN